jgi:hypothetical protein
MVSGLFEEVTQVMELVLERLLFKDVHYPTILTSPFPYAGKS